ncbi:MAG: hypothetical protein KCHDKBKB_02642 [Elusimicrobia bacterium]|nr:hypothetical protein [Elusimicrobiota bacterium]
MKPVISSELTISSLTAFSQEWREPAWVLQLRLKALQNFESLPWPDERDEKWKRTGLKDLNWEKLPLLSGFSFGSQLELSVELREQGVAWFSLEEAIKLNSERLEKAWAHAIERASKNKFLSLTLALANAGGCLVVPKGLVVKSPLHLPREWKKSSSAAFPLNFIFVEEAAEVSVWEELENSESNDFSFVSSYTLVDLKENAKASLTFLQEWNERTWHFQFQEVTQAAFSKFNAVAVSMGGHVFHNEATLHLLGQGAENKILGVNFGGGAQTFENWITQRHEAPRTISDIQYRGALKGAAKSFFSGLVSITKEAQQSDAYQSAKSLLLSTSARADAIPNLEILADDVKCSHGAAVGPVDEEQKYYLQTRGISPTQAEEIIIQGFFEPVIAEVPSPQVQDKLRTFIEEKLRK